MEKRIDVKCIKLVDSQEKVLFRQTVFMPEDVYFDFSGVERVLRVLFPDTQFVIFSCGA